MNEEQQVLKNTILERNSFISTLTRELDLKDKQASSASENLKHTDAAMAQVKKETQAELEELRGENDDLKI